MQDVTTPTTPTSGVARLVRALLVGTCTVVLAALGHRFGGGTWAPLVVMLPVALAASALAWAVTGRRLQVKYLAVLMAAAQLVVHVGVCYIHGHLMLPSVAMWAAHLGSATLTGLLVSRADRVWWALLGPLLRCIRVIQTAPAPLLSRWRRRSVAVPRTVLLGHTVLRRGPPLT